jgi:hypothetical protein
MKNGTAKAEKFENDRIESDDFDCMNRESVDNITISRYNSISDLNATCNYC